MNLPTSKEINPISEDLDGQCAEDHFLGMSLTEAEALFRDNAFYYCGDLLWMGPIAFVYYFKAALSFLESDDSRMESDFVNSMIGTLDSRLFGEYEDFNVIKSGRDDYIAFCKCVLNDYDKFEIIEEVYGDLRPHIEGMLEKLLS